MSRLSPTQIANSWWVSAKFEEFDLLNVHIIDVLSIKKSRIFIALGTHVLIMNEKL